MIVMADARGMSLWLIGYRGCGKTTVGRLLGQHWGIPNFDADDCIEQRAGKTIAEIFASGGEVAFRDLESAVVAELAQRIRTGDRAVVSLGGGAVLREENRLVIRGVGRVVWLRASAETLLARIEADAATAARRPNLTGAGGIEEVRAMLAIREPIYRDCADLIVEAGDRDPAAIAEEIASLCSTLES